MTNFQECSDVTEKGLVIKFYKMYKYIFLSKECERLNGTELEGLHDKVSKNAALEAKIGLEQ